ncbi:MAG: hypothetical protein BWY75_03097 [bacterium ADurb.Bin425]|nr:MAG: hypothetical protein BWY75_03097 [bacterium ADurb.Bin425]
MLSQLYVFTQAKMRVYVDYLYALGIQLSYGFLCCLSGIYIFQSFDGAFFGGKTDGGNFMFDAVGFDRAHTVWFQDALILRISRNI